MARYAGGTVQIITYATKADGTALVNTDVNSATATIYDDAGMQLATGSMTWDPARAVWYYDWLSPSVVGVDADFFAKCTLVSSSLQFTNNDWRKFSVKQSPV